MFGPDIDLAGLVAHAKTQGWKNIRV
jgi:hypothetical protein